MKEPHYDGMRKLLLIIMIVVPSIPFFLVLGIGYFYFTTSLEDSAIATMNRIVDDHQHMIAAFLDERKGAPTKTLTPDERSSSRLSKAVNCSNSIFVMPIIHLLTE